MADDSPSSRRVKVLTSQGAFRGLWSAVAALTRGRGLGNPLDVLKSARMPGHRLLGGSYRAGAHPVLIGPGKCAKKGHRPTPSRRGYGPITLHESLGGRQVCSRCAPGWDAGYLNRERDEIRASQADDPTGF